MPKKSQYSLCFVADVIIVIRLAQISLQQYTQVFVSVFRSYGIASNLVILDVLEHVELQ